MSQMNLFTTSPSPKKLTRRSDPSSSLKAANEIVNTGILQTQVLKVIALVEECPGRTSRELWSMAELKKMRLDRYTIAKRLPDAANQKLVRQGDQRKCRLSNRMCVTWWPVVQNEQQQQEEGTQS